MKRHAHPTVPPTKVKRASLPWKDWPEEDLDRVIQMAWDRTRLKRLSGSLG